MYNTGLHTTQAASNGTGALSPAEAHFRCSTCGLIPRPDAPKFQNFLEFLVTVLLSAHGKTCISQVGTQDPPLAGPFLLCALNLCLLSALPLGEVLSPWFAPIAASLIPASSLYLSWGFYLQCLMPTDPNPSY